MPLHDPLCPRCGADQREDPNPDPRDAKAPEEALPEADLMNLLLAGLVTQRPELLHAFDAQMKLRIKSGGASKESLLTLLDTVSTLATEVYDTRRAMRAMEYAAKQAQDALKGIPRHVSNVGDIHTALRSGSLPDDYGCAALARAVRDQTRAEEGE